MERFDRVEPDSRERAGEGFVKRVRFRTAGGRAWAAQGNHARPLLGPVVGILRQLDARLDERRLR